MDRISLYLDGMLNESEKTKFLQDLENDHELESAFLGVEKITLSLREQPQLEPPEQIFNAGLITNLEKNYLEKNNLEKSNIKPPKFYFNPKLAAQLAAAFIIFCVAATGLNFIINKPASAPAPLTMESRNSRIETANGADVYQSDQAVGGTAAYAGEAKISDSNIYIRRFVIHLSVKDLDAAISALNELGGESVSSEYNLSGKFGSAYISKKVNLNSYWNYIERLKTLGEASYSAETAELATARVLDPEAKIAARRAQYQRLNDILSQIISVKDLDYLERAMIDLEIEIASINSQLYAFNESVQRPVIDIYLNENPEPPAVFAQNFGEKFSGGFKTSFENTSNGIKALFIFIAGGFFQIIFIAIVIFAVVIIAKKGRKQ